MYSKSDLQTATLDDTDLLSLWSKKADEVHNC